MGRLAKNKILPFTGVITKVAAFVENEDGSYTLQAKGVGRGAGMNFQDGFPAFGMDELSVDGSDEYAYGPHAGSGTISQYYGQNVMGEDMLPNRDEHRPSHVTLPLLTFAVIFTEGPNKGKVKEEFRHCRITGRDGNLNNRGLFSGSLRFLYGFHNKNKDLDIDSATIVDELPTTA